MRSSLTVFAATVLAAASADAQYGSAQASGPSGAFAPQTAMGALGRNAMLTRGGAVSAQGPLGPRISLQSGSPSGRTASAVTKPFSGVTPTPTISPYLNLFREEDSNAPPNYFAFVRPQQQQREASRQQQEQLNQLQRQVRQASYAAPASGAAGAARYGDTGRFYGGWRR